MVIEDVSQGEISRNPRAYQELIAAAAAQTDLVSALTAMFSTSEGFAPEARPTRRRWCRRFRRPWRPDSPSSRSGEGAGRASRGGTWPNEPELGSHLDESRAPPLRSSSGSVIS
jgi:hypothetical protein